MKKVKQATQKAQRLLRQHMADAMNMNLAYSRWAEEENSHLLKEAAELVQHADITEQMELLLEYPELDMEQVQFSYFPPDEEGEQALQDTLQRMRDRYRAMRQTIIFMQRIKDRQERKTKDETIARITLKQAVAIQDVITALQPAKKEVNDGRK